MDPAAEPALIPAGLRELVCGHTPEAGVTGDAWLASLPRLVAECLERWDLSPDGRPMHGMAALVLPVRRRAGAGPGRTVPSRAVLKVTWPHPEARHEHLALRHWSGRGAVRLLAADPSRWAMLLERLDAGRDLHSLDVEEACRITGSLLAQLDRPALPQLDRLSAETERMAREFGQAPDVIPRRFLDQARSLAGELADDPGVDARLVHTDLHYANVLAAPDPDRGRWLAIDPKPLAAEPAFAVAPALWNRWDEARAAPDLQGALRRRLALICETAGVDEDRARAWTIVREVQNALWEAERPQPTTAQARTVSVTLIKAMQPD